MVSLGCPKNTVDGEVMLGDLHGAGFDVTDDHESADAIVINSCGFVEEQEDHRDGMLGAAVRERSGERAAGGGRDRGV